MSEHKQINRFATSKLNLEIDNVNIFDIRQEYLNSLHIYSSIASSIKFAICSYLAHNPNRGPLNIYELSLLAVRRENNLHNLNLTLSELINNI